MENELNEVLVEEEKVLSNVTNHTSVKGVILGVAAVTVGVLLFKFRRKISTKIEDVMVNRLYKKGYSVISPTEVDEISESIDEIEKLVDQM